MSHRPEQLKSFPKRTTRHHICKPTREAKPGVGLWRHVWGDALDGWFLLLCLPHSCLLGPTTLCPDWGWESSIIRSTGQWLVWVRESLKKGTLWEAVLNSLPCVLGSLDQPERSRLILHESLLLLSAQFLNFLLPLGGRHFLRDPRPRVLYEIK